MDSSRKIAPNYTNSGYGGNIPGHFAGQLANGYFQEQLAIAVFRNTSVVDRNYGRFGITLGQLINNVATPGPPWTVRWDGSIVYENVIVKDSPPDDDLTSNHPFDENKIAQTIAHEIGHNLAMLDFFQHTCPPIADTVMVSGDPDHPQLGSYFQPTKNANDCAWNNIPTTYSATSLGQLRVR